MYRIIASDLDETLLNSQKHVSKQDLDTISNLNNCYFVIATGRGFEAARQIIEEIGQYNKPNTYAITFNGGVIIENKDNRILYSNLMNFNDVERLVNIGLKYDVCIEVCALDCYYCYKLFDNEKNLFINGNIPFKEISTTDISFLKDTKIAKVLYVIEDMDYLHSIKEEIKVDDKFSVSFSSNCYMEINPKGTSKGIGLQNLCKILNIDIKDTIGVGDNYNDLELIKMSGLGIGVKNAINEIKPYCDLILDSTNNESPITEIVNKFIK